MYDVIIIGAGIVGSACAYHLAQYQLSIAVLEKDNDVSNGTSKANSAIIHAGFDPKPGTKMAKLNVEGVELTKHICKKLDVPYRQCGAMVLAFGEEDDSMVRTLYQRGIENGVPHLQILNHDQVRKKEPWVSDQVSSALYAPTSAIVSPWELTLAMAETAVRNGAELHLNHTVQAIRKEKDIFHVVTNQGEYTCRYLINAAGVNSDIIHEMIGEKEFTIIPTNGQYFLLDKAEGKRVNHTLFPCPSITGKGVLVSPTVHGNLIVGPNAIVSERDDVSTTQQGLHDVKRMALRSVPSIQWKENIRNFAGVRARSDREDFIIEESHSVSNFYNIAGIGSPGLSSATAIGAHVIDWLMSKQCIEKKTSYVDHRERVRFKELDATQRQALIKQQPTYGRIICRCETISEGEILQTFKTPIPPTSIDGIKRRVNAGMGRCQGGFCSVKVAAILRQQLGLSALEVLQDQQGSTILLQPAKEDL